MQRYLWEVYNAWNFQFFGETWIDGEFEFGEVNNEKLTNDYQKTNEELTVRIFFSVFGCDNIIIDKWDMKRRNNLSFVSLLQKNMDKE